MKLKELLEITTLDTEIKIDAINQERVKCVTQYGNREIIHQYIENGILIILTK
jgi:hypothetical protein